jgi:hypothetical protein
MQNAEKTALEDEKNSSQILPDGLGATTDYARLQLCLAGQKIAKRIHGLASTKRKPISLPTAP